MIVSVHNYLVFYFWWVFCNIKDIDGATSKCVHLNQPYTLAVILFVESKIWEQLEKPVVERHVCQTCMDK